MLIAEDLNRVSAAAAATSCPPVGEKWRKQAKPQFGIKSAVH